MGKGNKKSGCKNHAVEKLVLATAILNLVEALVEIIRKLLE